MTARRHGPIDDPAHRTGPLRKGFGTLQGSLLGIVLALLASSSRASGSYAAFPQDSWAASQLARPLKASSGSALLASEADPLVTAGEGSEPACAWFFSFAASGSAASEGALPGAAACRTASWFTTAKNPANCTFAPRAKSTKYAIERSDWDAATELQLIDYARLDEGESGVQHLIRNRYFSPELGRFLQADPMGYADSTNLYQGFGSNPVNWVDPMGLSAESLIRRLLAKLPTRNWKWVRSWLREKGLAEYYRVHHIVDREFYSSYSTWFKKIGFEIDAHRNLILLPTKEARELGLRGAGRSLHTGRHLGEYVRRVEASIERIYAAEASGKISPSAALEKMTEFQNELRRGLKSGEIALQADDIERLRAGPIIVSGLAITIGSAEAAEAVASGRDPANDDAAMDLAVDLFKPDVIQAMEFAVEKGGEWADERRALFPDTAPGQHNRMLEEELEDDRSSQDDEE